MNSYCGMDPDREAQAVQELRREPKVKPNPRDWIVHRVLSLTKRCEELESKVEQMQKQLQERTPKQRPDFIMHRVESLTNRCTELENAMEDRQR